ncbi:MAG TPA: hypothetical protein V6D06_06565 [Trichocoleus sp.]
MQFRYRLQSLRVLVRRRYSLWLLLGLSLVWLASSLGHPASAQTVTRAQVTEILDGNQVFIQGRQVPVNSVAQRQQQVRTAAARAELQFNTGAVARLAQNSSLTVGDCAQLRRGTLLVNGALNGCTSSTLAGVRGTLYTLEVTEADQTIIRVFEGEVLVSPRPGSSIGDSDFEESELEEGMGEEENLTPELSPQVETDPTVDPNPNSSDLSKGAKEQLQAKQSSAGAEEEDSPVTEEATPAAQTVPLTAEEPVAVSEGQQITIAAGEPEGVVEPLSIEDFRALLQGPLLSDFTSELPGVSELQSSFERLFPGVPFPVSLPGLSIPSIPFSFPF